MREGWVSHLLINKAISKYRFTSPSIIAKLDCHHFFLIMFQTSWFNAVLILRWRAHDPQVTKCQIILLSTLFVGTSISIIKSPTIDPNQGSQSFHLCLAKRVSPYLKFDYWTLAQFLLRELLHKSLNSDFMYHLKWSNYKSPTDIRMPL